jgi:hypothetical protein
MARSRYRTIAPVSSEPRAAGDRTPAAASRRVTMDVQRMWAPDPTCSKIPDDYLA